MESEEKKESLKKSGKEEEEGVSTREDYSSGR